MHDPAALELVLERSMPEPMSGCWLWLGYACHNGYGRVRFEGKSWLAHRVAWFAHHGPIPEGMHLCHKCDNPGCINPAHMFVGTQADNVRDMIRKGRENRDPRPYQRGELNQNSRITADVVRSILLSPLNQRDAAAAFGVAPSWVQRIRKREVWRHVDVPAEQLPPRRFFTKRRAA